MILFCENCDTRYLIADSQIGPEGRRVRCSHCGHEWYQEPPEDNFAAILAETDPIPESVKPVPEGSALPALPEFDEAEEQRAAQNGMAGNILATIKRNIGGAAVAAATAGCILAGALFAGDAVVRLWPPALAAYDLAGRPPQIAGAGLVIDRVQARINTTDTAPPVLHVTGYILNLQETAQDIPPLRVFLYRDNDELIDSWLVLPAQPSLKYEEETSFVAIYPAMVEGAHKVSVRFEPYAKLSRRAD